MYSLTRLGRAIDTVIPIKRYEGGWGGGKGKYEDIFCSTLCSSDSLTYCWAFFKLDFFLFCSKCWDIRTYHPK